MKHNEHQIREVKKLADRLNVDRLLIKNIEVRSLTEAELWLPKNEKFRRYDYSGHDYIVKGSGKESCPRPWLSTLINWDGSLSPVALTRMAIIQWGKSRKSNQWKRSGRE